MRQSLSEFSEQSEFLFGDEQILATPYFEDILNMRFVPIVRAERKSYRRIKSEAEELVETAIPIENRIAHFVPYIDVEPSLEAEHETQYTIARKLGIYVRQVVALGNKIGIETMGWGRRDTGMPIYIYPEFSSELIREEAAWDKAYEDLPEELSISDLERVIHKSGKWITQTAEALRYAPRLENRPHGRVPNSHMYPKVLAAKLRHIILSYPPAGNWYVVDELEVITGRPSEWIVRQFGKVGIETEQRWSGVTGKLSTFYPPDSPEIVDYLIDKLPARAGNWLDEPAVASEIGMKIEWTKSQLRRLFSSTLEMRINDYNRSTRHYSPDMVKELKTLAEEIKSYPEVGDWVSMQGLETLVGKSYQWITARLPYIQEQPEMRRNNQYRLFLYYPPSTVEALLRINLSASQS